MSTHDRVRSAARHVRESAVELRLAKQDVEAALHQQANPPEDVLDALAELERRAVAAGVYADSLFQAANRIRAEEAS